jgi:hypothetical protein
LAYMRQCPPTAVYLMACKADSKRADIWRKQLGKPPVKSLLAQCLSVGPAFAKLAPFSRDAETVCLDLRRMRAPGAVCDAMLGTVQALALIDAGTYCQGQFYLCSVCHSVFPDDPTMALWCMARISARLRSFGPDFYSAAHCDFLSRAILDDPPSSFPTRVRLSRHLRGCQRDRVSFALVVSVSWIFIGFGQITATSPEMTLQMWDFLVGGHTVRRSVAVAAALVEHAILNAPPREAAESCDCECVSDIQSVRITELVDLANVLRRAATFERDKQWLERHRL